MNLFDYRGSEQKYFTVDCYLIKVAKKAPWMTPDKLGNFEPEEEPVGDGPGEGGKAYRLPADRQNDVDESIGNYGMNMAVSDAISLERAIPDTRQAE